MAERLGQGRLPIAELDAFEEERHDVLNKLVKVELISAYAGQTALMASEIDEMPEYRELTQQFHQLNIYGRTRGWLPRLNTEEV